MIVDRAVYGSEFLEGLHPPESLHRPSPERLVRILGSVFEPPAYLLTVGVVLSGNNGKRSPLTARQPRWEPPMRSISYSATGFRLT